MKYPHIGKDTSGWRRGIKKAGGARGLTRGKRKGAVTSSEEKKVWGKDIFHTTPAQGRRQVRDREPATTPFSSTSEGHHRAAL